MSRNRFRITSRAEACAGLFLLLVLTERPARAYVDPGSGALVWQGLLAAVVGSAFYFRRIFGRIKARLFKNKDD
ncbi:MAG TPA: hypothetical protein VLY04_22505 [Bryobacteraceae bacterium]|nr:hypothetical protein [Bryobacteraceae bacterium]